MYKKYLICTELNFYSWILGVEQIIEKNAYCRSKIQLFLDIFT